ncbi:MULTISPECIES: hypothetical protein [unclassified Nostoc]|uniref:hypothetical protein n=1 Tax=unclassified Nostoc TaxID=2593658 RepID=UPI002AD3DDDC|nr:hypothetical protein [Nostoc sp. DedQUE03]MDZ7974081.1 hypothetical protein [Nostoc sp. DedQUE03]MDZ8042987.1 hypothetical protein [Nostoc sp. DedQUE02]
MPTKPSDFSNQTGFLYIKNDGMRGLALQSLKYCYQYNFHNQSLWLGINYGDRSYGTAIASLMDQPAIASRI